MARMVLTRPKTAEEIPAYQKALREALEEVGVGHGEQFVVVAKSEIDKEK